jgi:hypothetical protein
MEHLFILNPHKMVPMKFGLDRFHGNSIVYELLYKWCYKIAIFLLNCHSLKITMSNIYSY